MRGSERLFGGRFRRVLGHWSVFGHWQQQDFGEWHLNGVDANFARSIIGGRQSVRERQLARHSSGPGRFSGHANAACVWDWRACLWRGKRVQRHLYRYSRRTAATGASATIALREEPNLEA